MSEKSRAVLVRPPNFVLRLMHFHKLSFPLASLYFYIQKVRAQVSKRDGIMGRVSCGDFTPDPHYYHLLCT